MKSREGRETASSSWQREACRQTQSEPGEQMVTLNQSRDLREQRFDQQQRSSSHIGDCGSSQHSYSVLEPAPSLPPSPPPPPVGRPPKSSSSHVIACEVYSDVFEPSPGDPIMEGPWKSLDSSSSPWKTVDPMEGPAHDSGLSSASASTNSSSGPSELEVNFFSLDNLQHYRGCPSLSSHHDNSPDGVSWGRPQHCPLVPGNYAKVKSSSDGDDDHDEQ